MTTQTDTHEYVVTTDYQADSGIYLESDLSKSELLKSSNKKGYRLKNFNIGAGNEDCADFNRGYGTVLSKGSFDSTGAKQAVTIKGGFSEFLFNKVKFDGKPKYAHVVLGQYSDYNFREKLKTTKIYFKDCVFEKKRWSIICWNADKPIFENCKGSLGVLMVPKVIVWAYFSFRKLQQYIEFGKEGRK